MYDANVKWQASRPQVTRWHPFMRLRNTLKERHALSKDEETNLETLAGRRAELNWLGKALQNGKTVAGDNALSVDDVKWISGMAGSTKSQQSIATYMKTKMTLDPAARTFLDTTPKAPPAGGTDFVDNMARVSIAQHGKLTLNDWRTIGRVISYEHMSPGGIRGTYGPLTDPKLNGALTRRGLAFSRKLLADDAASGGRMLDADARDEIRKAVDGQAEATNMSEPDYRGPGPLGR
jgi:hypothetical protein